MNATQVQRTAAPRRATVSRTAAASALLLATAALLLALRLHLRVDAYDEGVVLHGAEKLAAGHVPYRDFWTVYTPGQLYVVAAAFKTFGVSLLSERLVDLAFRLALSALLYTLLARLTTRKFALLPCLLLTLKLGYVGAYGYSVFPALAAAFLSSLAVQRFCATSEDRWLTIGGAGVAVAALFRQDFGLYALLANAGVLLLAAAQSLDEPRSLRGALLTGARRAGLLTGYALAALAPAAVYLVAVAGHDVLIYDLFTFPLTTLRALRALPLPRLDFGLLPGAPATARGPLEQAAWLQFYGPLLVYAVQAAVLRRAWRQHVTAREQQRTRGETFALLFGLLLFNQALSRYDEPHALPTLLCAGLLVSALIARLLARPRRPAVILPVYLGLAWACTLFVTQPLGELLKTLIETPPGRCLSDLSRADCAATDPDQTQAVRFVQQTTRPGEPIFVGNELRTANDVSFYFLAGRPSAVRQSVFDPGVVSSTTVQAEMLREIADAGVETIVLVEAVATRDQDAAGASAGAYPLPAYLHHAFHPVFTAGAYQVLTRR